jgi:hypothetical protein
MPGMDDPGVWAICLAAGLVLATFGRGRAVNLVFPALILMQVGLFGLLNVATPKKPSLRLKKDVRGNDGFFAIPTSPPSPARAPFGAGPGLTAKFGGDRGPAALAPKLSAMGAGLPSPTPPAIGRPPKALAFTPKNALPPAAVVLGPRAPSLLQPVLAMVFGPAAHDTGSSLAATPILPIAPTPSAGSPGVLIPVPSKIDEWIVFLVDSSESMRSNNYFSRAKAEVLAILQAHREVKKFQVIFFSSNLRYPFPDRTGWLTRDEAILSELETAMAKIDPAGGTEPLPGLLAAFALNPTGGIYFLTDGEFALKDDDEKAVREAGSRGLKVHGTLILDRKVPGEISTVETIAKLTGGNFFERIKDFKP